MSIFLDDGTEVDDEDVLMACENGTISHFVPDGEKFQTASTNEKVQQSSSANTFVSENNAGLSCIQQNYSAEKKLVFIYFICYCV